MGLNVPETLAGKLSEIPGVEVIERTQWKKLVDVLRLQLSDLFDQENAAQLGERLGAQVMGLGSFAVFQGNVNLTLRFVDVETGAVLGGLNRVSPVDERLFEAFSALALEAVEVLNREVIGGEVASVSPEEMLEIPEETKEKIKKPAAKTFDAYELYGKGKEAHDQNRWDEAITLHQQALALDPDYAEAWEDLGTVLTKRGRFDEAEEGGRRALTLFTESGEEKGRGEALRNLGDVAAQKGRYDEAERLFQESLAIYRRLGDEPGIGGTLNNLGTLAYDRRRYDEAERLLQESLAISRRLSVEPNVAQTLNNLGIIARNSGRYDEAERLSQEALTIRKRIGDEPGVAETLLNLAYLADLQGSRGQAVGYAREALGIYRRVGISGGVAYAEDLLRELGDR